MKINITSIKKGTRFSELKPLDIFESNGFFYMKIEEINTKYVIELKKNAIFIGTAKSVASGYYSYFNENEQVTPYLDSELIIK